MLGQANYTVILFTSGLIEENKMTKLFVRVNYAGLYVFSADLDDVEDIDADVMSQVLEKEIFKILSDRGVDYTISRSDPGQARLAMEKESK